MSLLEGRLALVTGGAGGIGLAVARALGAQGARLILNDLGTDLGGEGADGERVEAAAAQLISEGAEVITSRHDVRDRAQVAEMVGLAEGLSAPIDILVNCAGIIQNRGLHEMTDEAWRGVLATDLTGSFLCTQAVSSALRRKKCKGSIVNMTSVSGLLGNVGQLNESAAKAGVYGLTRTSSIELQKYGITVNAIAAIARTRQTEHLPMFEKVHGSLEPEHIAPAVVFLVSELAEGLSGVVLSVAGGRIATIALTESQGRLKEANGGVWTPQEIAEHYGSIARK